MNVGEFEVTEDGGFVVLKVTHQCGHVVEMAYGNHESAEHDGHKLVKEDCIECQWFNDGAEDETEYAIFGELRK